jgi:hypothetical protein
MIMRVEIVGLTFGKMALIAKAISVILYIMNPLRYLYNLF